MSRIHSLSEIIKRSILSLIMLGGVALMFAQALDAQSFDHEPYPKLDFNFVHLNIELGVQPQNLRIDGAATYKLEANVNGADTLILYAAHMDISSASVNGQETEFQLQNDSLFIPFAEPAEKGQVHEVRIRYSTDARFGLLKNNSNTVWTSLLPRSQRHWVPIVDNPHVSLRTTFFISVPADYSVWATGEKSGEESVTEEVMKYQFSSGTEIPASELAFAIGNFQSQSTTYGIKRINVMVEQDLAGQVAPRQLLQQAYTMMEQVEQEMQSEFPYSRLNIVVMKDHSWEMKSWGGSAIFIYQNRGSLQNQLLRGIIGQWIGSKQRAARWSDADAITLYQTLVQQSLTDDMPMLEVEDQPRASSQHNYDLFGPARWNAWQERWSQWKGQSMNWIVSNTHPTMMRRLMPVIRWDDYANLWYRQSGQPMFNPSDLLSQPDTSAGDQATADSVGYRVQYQMDETGENVLLAFESVRGVYDELTTLQAHKVYGDGIDTEEITFTGLNDSVSVSISPDIRTLRLEVPDGLKLEIEEHKPVPFLLYELRNAESVEQRARAARNLGMHADNPDLQLAIGDALENTSEPEVRAALLSSLADITQGAAGTEQLFLDALQHDHPLVQKAGLKALENYPESPDIQSTVRKMIANAANISIFKQGVAALSGIASEQELESFLSEIAQQDTVGYRSVAAIQQLAENGQTGSLSEASRFLGEEYDYGVRQMALQLLIEYDNTAGSWLQRGQKLLAESPDPRIRYLVVRGMLENQNPDIISFLEKYAADEYDARVYYEIQRGIGE
ncbi:MAG TPA: hypothetical protein VK074_02375 [Fodinibius sp.]|nr:hypothetical protein [Fodinibius sp.]